MPQIFCVHNYFASFSPFNLIYPHPDPQLRRLDPESEGDTLLYEQQWRPFPLMWGTLWQKYQRRLSFTELAWQWKSKSRPHHSLPLKKKKKRLSIFIGSSSLGPTVFVWCHSWLCIDFCPDFYRGLAQVACCSQGFTPKLPL